MSIRTEDLFIVAMRFGEREPLRYMSDSEFALLLYTETACGYPISAQQGATEGYVTTFERMASSEGLTCRSRSALYDPCELQNLIVNNWQQCPFDDPEEQFDDLSDYNVIYFVPCEAIDTATLKQVFHNRVPDNWDKFLAGREQSGEASTKKATPTQAQSQQPWLL